jgi:hypothetical protein
LSAGSRSPSGGDSRGGPRIGAYVASAWLLLVALNLVVAGHFDVAVRGVVMSIAAFTLARAIEVRATVSAPSPVHGYRQGSELA